MAESNYANSPLARLLQAKASTSIQPAPIEHRVYKNVNINLDGYHFANCVFINCNLYTSKGTFQLKDCHVQQVTIYYQQEALKIVKLSSILLGNWDHS